MGSWGSDADPGGRAQSSHAAVLVRECASLDDPMVRKWTLFRNTILPGGGATRAGEPVIRAEPSGKGPGAAGSVVYWRLVASNNRDLGRSSYLYGTADQARRHIERVIHAGRLELSAIVDGSTTRRGWVLTSDGEPVMTCARWYGSSSTAASSAVSALAAFRSAQIVVLPPSAPPRSRSRDHDAVL